MGKKEKSISTVNQAFMADLKPGVRHVFFRRSPGEIAFILLWYIRDNLMGDLDDATIRRHIQTLIDVVEEENPELFREFHFPECWEY